jgi:hypothetical protein
MTQRGRFMLPTVTVRGSNLCESTAELFELSLTLAETEGGPLWADAIVGYEMTSERERLLEDMSPYMRGREHLPIKVD